MKYQINSGLIWFVWCYTKVFPHVLSMYSNVLLHSSMIALVVFQTLFLSIFTLKYKKKILFETKYGRGERKETCRYQMLVRMHIWEAATGCPRKFCPKIQSSKKLGEIGWGNFTSEKSPNRISSDLVALQNLFRHPVVLSKEWLLIKRGERIIMDCMLQKTLDCVNTVAFDH